MTALVAGSGPSTGYGSALQRRPGDGDAHPGSHAGAGHEQNENAEPIRSRGRLVAVGAGLLVAAVAIAGLALVSMPLGDDVDLPIPSMALGAPPSPHELLEMSAPELLHTMRTSSAVPVAAQTAHETALTIKAVVNPFPDIKYNVFDPKPISVHHRWTKKRLRQEARQLVLLVNEAQAWEDEKYKREVPQIKGDTTGIDDTLASITKIERSADKHLKVIAEGLHVAETGIAAAADVTDNLQDNIDYKEDKTKRKVWEMIDEMGDQLHWDQLLQGYKDRQIRKDMDADGKMNYLSIKRYNKEVADQKQRIHGWIQGLRGRIQGNFSHIQHEEAGEDDVYHNLKLDQELQFDEQYSKFMHTKKKVAKDVESSADIVVRAQLADNAVSHEQQAMNKAIETSKRVSDGVDALDKVIGDQHLSDEKLMVTASETYEALKSKLSMLITSLTTVQGAIQEQQEAHSALKTKEDGEMKKLKGAVETLKPDLQSILDLDGVVKNLQSGTQSNIDDAVTHFNGVNGAQEQLGVDNTAMLEKMNLLNHSVADEDKFIHADGYMSSYADIQTVLDPVKLEEDEVVSMHASINQTADDFKTWSAALVQQVSSMQQARTQWKKLSAEADAQLKLKVNSTIASEQSGIAGMFAAIKDVQVKIQAAKDFRESSLAVNNQLRQELAETTQSLEGMDKKFGDMYAALGEEIEKLSNTTEGIAAPEDIQVGEDRAGLRVQETIDGIADAKPETEYIKKRWESETERLNKMREKLKVIKKEVNLAIMRAKELLNRHPNLFERISCVCYDGDKLNGKCIAGSMADESTCDPCPGDSYCVRGLEFPCKTTCPGGLVLTGTCAIGSVSDVTTCEPSLAGFYSESGEALLCRTTCEPGFELRGTCPVGSSSDTTRCAKCPAGFFCQDGKTQECKTSCEAGLVLTGKCTQGASTDVITCEPSPAGHYSEIGAAIPCKPSCEDGLYLTDECPAGSTSDTSTCSECPEGAYCTGGKVIPCKVSCEKGEELTGTCPAGSSEDVTVCMRCPEGHYCEEGKTIPCRTSCDGGKYLQGRCRKGSTEDTTVCRKCKSDFFCTDGDMTPCKSECDHGYTLEGKCERGSATDTTVCEACPEDFYCTTFSKYECKRRCWEGKILVGKCEVASFEDTTECEQCPDGNFCKKGIAFECKTECEDGNVLKGECAKGSSFDTTSCNPCPAGSFCKDGKVEPCKDTCEDGQLLEGFCRSGSTHDKTECVPCPAGSFCVDGKAQECVHSCPSGQTLVGSCEEGSTTAITHCESCPAGSFCRDDKVEECKTTCPAGQFLEGACDAGASRDKTSCTVCPEDFFCVDGNVEKCKETCGAGQQLNGDCKAGSTEDVTTCDPCPAGSYCTDGIIFPCSTESSCALGLQFVGECAAGSESDTTSCDPCPPGSYCRDGVARSCRTIIDCVDGHKIDGSCPGGSDVNTICKPCRAGVFCVGGVETPCKATCEDGQVLVGFCASGSPADTTTCGPAPEGWYAHDGVAAPCLTTCEAGTLLGGTCPEGGAADGMSCTPCPEESWCEEGIQEACTVDCPNGKVLAGSCPEGSKSDTVVCDPCPAGSFCSDNAVIPCKTECTDGKFLEGECSPGCAEDETHCTPCPSGVFCKGMVQTVCTSTPDGQLLQGFCAAGSTEDTVTCAPCPDGSSCTGGAAVPCKTTCDDGEEFKGACLEGSATDTTVCDVCPAGFYCQDGLKAECKTDCAKGSKLVGNCTVGSVTDQTMCRPFSTPRPMFVNFLKARSASENVNEDNEGSDRQQNLRGHRLGHDRLGSEIRLTSAAGTPGFIEGRIKMPLQGGKWNVQFNAFWPAFSKNGVSNHGTSTFPLQSYGEQVDDTVTATMNGQVVEMSKPSKLPGESFFLVDFVGDELVWRFDFKSNTPEPLARPFIVSGEVTLLRDSTTGDEGAGIEKGKAQLKGTVLNAVDGKKISQAKASTDGFTKKGLIIDSEPRILLFQKSKFMGQIPIKGGRYRYKMAPGKYTCIAILKGLMSFYDDDCTIVGKRGKTQRNIIFTPFVLPGEVRTVLTWGAEIRDLDSYMLAPHADVTHPPCEVNWSNKKCSSGSVNLDNDEKGGFGPETITAHGLRNGKYRFRVTEYRGPAENRERLLLSKALVSVYTAVDVKTFEIGREGDGFIRGNDWYVFTMDGDNDGIYPCTTDSCGNGYHSGAGRNNR